MEVTVLAVPDCPGAALLRERLAAVGSQPGIQVITSQDEALAAGMRGSPTLLVDGTDPFAGPGQRPALACRLYPQEDGSLAGAPPVGELRRVLSRR